MRKLVVFTLISFFATIAASSPVLQMNRAFMALADVIPFLTQQDAFMEKKNEKLILEKITELQKAFKAARHDTVLKTDLFAPSYAVINESIDHSLESFKQGKKDFAHWRLKEITSHCLDCHTRLPPSHSSSFQNGEFSINAKKFDDPYNLGIVQLIVRRYVDAKQSFIRSIQDRMITRNFQDIMMPFKQLLLIDTKVLKNPANVIAVIQEYSSKKDLPEEKRKSLIAWTGRLNYWKGRSELAGLKNDSVVETLINKEFLPLKNNLSLDEGHDVDLLIMSGLLSNYLFENPASKKSPEINYWLGWSEKHLKREEFFGSGDLFLKQCIKKYPKHPVAKQCYKELQESVEFDFSGSSGTNIPVDVKEELMELKKLIKGK